MSDRDNIQSLLSLRKLTRVFRPQVVLGEYIQGGQKEATRKADKAFKDLQALYEAIAPSKPFYLQRELNPPLDFPRVGLEITPLDYVHVAQVGSDSRKIKVRCPLTWVLTYTDFPPTRLQELLDNKGRDAAELQRFVLSYIVLHLVATQDLAL